MRTRRLKHFAVATMLAACSGNDVADPAVGPPQGDASSIALSAPVPRSAIEGGSASGTVVFVSAAPGAFARGERALLGLKNTAASSAVPVAGGGFDAIAVVAEAGDEILVTIVDSADARLTETATVRAPMRPTVVRTSPGPHRSDVPLNIVIAVAFSAPMDSASVAAALQLRRGGAAVSGSVVFEERNLTVALFVPEAALAPGSEYVIELAGTARDVLGQALDSSVVTTFTTSQAAVAPAQGVAIASVASRSLASGEAVELTATACAQLYVPCRQVVAPIAWRSSAPGVATVAPSPAGAVPARAVVTARSSGTAFIIAASGTVADTIALFVLSTEAPSSLSANEIVFRWNSDLFAIRADGSGLTQLTTAGWQSDEPSVAADGRIVFVESPGNDPYARQLRVRELDGSVRSLTLPFPGSRWPPRCPAWSPDMRYIAYLQGAPGYEIGSVRVVHADSTTVPVDIATSERGTCPKWSPDGTRLVFGEISAPYWYDGPLYSYTEIVLWTLLDGVVGVPRRGSLVPGGWSPAGDAVAGIVGEERGFNSGLSYIEGWSFWLERLPIDGASAQRLLPLSGWFDDGEVAAPAWSPDGSLIAFGATPGRIWLIDASNSASRWWARELTSGFSPTFVPPGVRLTR
jgi:hypothetical protein